MKKITADILHKLINATEIEEEKLSNTLHDIKYGLLSNNKYNDFTIWEIKQLFKSYNHIRMYRFSQALAIAETHSALFPYLLWKKFHNLALSNLTDEMCKEMLIATVVKSKASNKKTK